MSTRKWANSESSKGTIPFQTTVQCNNFYESQISLSIETKDKIDVNESKYGHNEFLIVGDPSLSAQSKDNWHFIILQNYQIATI